MTQDRLRIYPEANIDGLTKSGGTVQFRGFIVARILGAGAR